MSKKRALLLANKALKNFNSNYLAIDIRKIKPKKNIYYVILDLINIHHTLKSKNDSLLSRFEKEIKKIATQYKKDFDLTNRDVEKCPDML